MTEPEDPVAELAERVAELEKEARELREDIKARETSRVGAMWTLFQDYRAYLKGDIEKLPTGSIRGAIHAFILPRMVLIVGSLVGVSVVSAQAWLMWKQTGLMEKQNALVTTSNQVLEDQFSEQRRATTNAERSQFLRAIYDRCMECDPDEDGTRPHAASLRARHEAATTLIKSSTEPVDLSGAELPGFGLQGLALDSADLRSTVLIEARMDGTSLRGADLQSANLTNALLDRANLSSSNLSQATAVGASLVRVQLVGAELFQTNLAGADLRRADFTDANVNSAVIANADLEGAIFVNSNLRSADLRLARIQNTDFSGANLRDAFLPPWPDGVVCHSDQTRWPSGFTVPEPAESCPSATDDYPLNPR